MDAGQWALLIFLVGLWCILMPTMTYFALRRMWREFTGKK